MPSTKSTSQKWLLPTNCNPYGRNPSDRQQPGAPSRLVDADALGGALKFYPRGARAAEVIRRGPARHDIRHHRQIVYVNPIAHAAQRIWGRGQMRFSKFKKEGVGG